MMKIIDMDAHPPIEGMEISHIGILTPEIFFNRLERAEIQMAAGTLLPPSDFSAVQQNDILKINEAALQIAETFPGRYIPGIWVHPAFSSLSCRQIELYADQSVKLIGEIQSEWLDSPQYHAGLADILSCAESCQMAVSIHPPKPEHLQSLAEAYPGLKFLYGSRQCRISPEQSVTLLNQYPNLYLRLSQDIFLGNYYLYSYVGRYPREQLLFGSGYPHCNPAAHLAAVQWELRKQNQDIINAIYQDNALRCLSGYKTDVQEDLSCSSK